MILITIGSLPLWVTNIWDDYDGLTWGDLALLTWGELMDCKNISTVKIANDSFEINDLVEDQSTCDFTLFDFTSSYHFYRGQPISVWDENMNLIFGGYLESVQEQFIGDNNNNFITHKISAIDNHYLANKRRVIKAFKEELVTDCVDWILDNVLDDEGITLGEITPSTVEITKVCNFMPVNQALDELAEAVGYTWFISHDKKLYFVDRVTYVSPFNITFINNYCSYVKNESFEVVDGNQEYRNVQYIKGSKERTDLQTESFKGDGETQTFTVAYPINEEPTIEVNGVSKTVGIKGVDTTEDWFWSKNDNTFTQKSDATKLTSSDKVTIQYYGTYNITVKSADYEAIANRAALEGTSGIVEESTDDNTLTTKEDALKRANDLLTTYAVEGKIITFETFTSGLESGQLIHIEFAAHNLDHDCLITEVKKYDDETVITYQVTCVSGPVNDYWVKFWAKALQTRRSSEDDGNMAEVLQVLLTFTKNWTELENPNIFRDIYPGESTFPEDLEWIGFADEDKIKYLQLDISGGYRRYRTSQTRTATQIVTTVIVPSADANAAMSEASLWGGNLATSIKDTGVKVTSHSLVYVKNDLESLLLVFTDNKWS